MIKKEEINETYSVPFFHVDIWKRIFSYLDINRIIAILRVSKGLNSISIKSILSDYSVIFDHVIHSNITVDEESIGKLYILFSNNFVCEEDNESLETDLSYLKIFQEEGAKKYNLNREKFTGKNLQKLYVTCNLDLESNIEDSHALMPSLKNILKSLIKLASLTFHDASIVFNFFLLSSLSSKDDKISILTIPV
jgi:hypothetical protein